MKKLVCLIFMGLLTACNAAAPYNYYAEGERDNVGREQGEWKIYAEKLPVHDALRVPGSYYSFARGQFHDGAPAGLWLAMNEHGSKAAEFHFTNGAISGPVKLFCNCPPSIQPKLPRETGYFTNGNAYGRMNGYHGNNEVDIKLSINGEITTILKGTREDANFVLEDFTREVQNYERVITRIGNYSPPPPDKPR